MRIGYHASHEQFDPAALLDYVQRAEAAGFHAAMCSDHFAPWSERQGQSASTFPWLGAALQATRLTFGTVAAPGQRQHPAMVAQAAATLAALYPGRFWLALGSGENLNEHITGDPWPPKDERQERLRQCVDIIRALFAGEDVTHEGLARVSHGRLYVRSQLTPPLYAAALSPDTAADAARWADGLIIAPGTPDKARAVIDAYREAGGTGKPVLAQIVVAYAHSDAEALAAAHDQWRQAALDADALASLPTPQAFDVVTATVTPQQLQDRLLASADLQRHVDLLRGYAALGIDTAYIHNVTRDQQTFIAAYARSVIPALAQQAA